MPKRKSRGAVRRRDTPLDRLYADGKTQNAQVRRRIQWLAQEWKIPADDIAKAMQCRVDTTVGFAEKYEVSLDWLLGGDLKGLQRMLHERKARTAGVSQVDRIMEKYHRLTSGRQKVIAAHIDRLLELQQ